ncbi:MAG: ABC transporter permease [candidate division Zixibacteria bacterium]|nr:ABC transporter permease [candidate division Zixibacteria bacterium]
MRRVFSLLRLFISDFNKQRKKIFLTVMAIGWGTVSIIMLLSFGEGLKRQLASRGASMGEGIVVVWPGQTSKAYKGLPHGRRIWMKPEDINMLKARIPDMLNVGGEYSRWGVDIRYGNKLIGRHMTGVTPSYKELRYHYAQRGGRFITQRDLDEKRRVAFLGDATAEELFGTEDPVGKQILIESVPFTVIGVMIDKEQMGMYSGPDNEKVVIPMTTFGTLMGDRWLDVLIFKPKNPDDVEKVKKEFYRVMGGKYKFDPTDERAFHMWDTIESSKEMYNVTFGIQIFLGIIGALTLLVAGVGVANIMYVTVRRRTKEIGIKMAMGAKSSYILIEFIIEAMLIGLLGGFMGFLLSGIIIKVLASIPIEDEALQFLGKPVISWEIAVATVLILVAIAFLAGFFPSRKASRINPAESLRYE